MALSLLPSAPPPEVAAAVPSRGLVARLGRRLLDARAVKALPASARKMSLRLQASIAESLLISRLRARTQRTQPSASTDVLARGARMVHVTCNSWFPAASTAPAASRTFRTLI